MEHLLALTQDQIEQKISEDKPKAKWPFSGMAVGEQVFCDVGQYGSTNPSIYAHTYAKSKGWKMYTKKVGENTYEIVRLK